MRQIATLPNEEQAQKLADYLLTLQIKTRLESTPTGWEVWVCDEDRVPQARQEVSDFTHNPDDPRYGSARRTAEALRHAEERQEKEYTRRQERLHERLTNPMSRGRGPVTIVLFVCSIVVTLLSNFGKSPTGKVYQAMIIAPFRIEETPTGLMLLWSNEWGGLDAIFGKGQVWRLVTPIFLHFDILHLGFDMYWLVALGMVIEARRGSLRFLLMVLAIAIGSNLAEYFLKWGMPSALVPMYEPSPMFGGMSGVVYGLLGYLWMKTRFDPEMGLFAPPGLVTWMIVWFFVCLFGIVGHVANMAHGAGLVIGMAIGYAPVAWRSLQGR